MWTTEFTVKGHGHFPVDMLRYDGCYPRTTEDAINLVHPHSPDSNIEVTLISVNKLRGWLPTEARWQSFGWSVVRVRQPVKI
jgi:hypothetical protein